LPFSEDPVTGLSKRPRFSPSTWAGGISVKGTGEIKYLEPNPEGKNVQAARCNKYDYAVGEA